MVNGRPRTDGGKEVPTADCRPTFLKDRTNKQLESFIVVGFIYWILQRMEINNVMLIGLHRPLVGSELSCTCLLYFLFYSGTTFHGPCLFLNNVSIDELNCGMYS